MDVYTYVLNVYTVHTYLNISTYMYTRSAAEPIYVITVPIQLQSGTTIRSDSYAATYLQASHVHSQKESRRAC